MFKTLTKWVSNVVNLVKKTAKQLVGYVVSAFKPTTTTTTRTATTTTRTATTTTRTAPVAPKATKVVKEEATTIRSAIKQPAETEEVVVELVLEDEATVVVHTAVKELTTQWIPDPPSKPPP